MKGQPRFFKKVSAYVSGYYMFIEAAGRRPGDNAKISRMVSLTGMLCFQFCYNMYGGNMGTLNVRLSNKVILTKKSNQGRQWHVTQIRLKGAGIKQVSIYFALIINALDYIGSYAL